MTTGKFVNYFSNQRHFPLSSGLGKVISKPILFSLSNSLGEIPAGRQAADRRFNDQGILNQWCPRWPYPDGGMLSGVSAGASASRLYGAEK